MKTKTWLIILLVLLLLVAYYFLGTGYLKQRQDYDKTTASLDAGSQTLAEVAAPPADLEARLAAARDGLEEARTSLPARMTSSRIIGTVLGLAEEHGVKAVPLSTSPWEEGFTGDYTYAVFRLQVNAAGSFADLVAFMDALESGDIPTLTIESAGIIRDETSETGGATAGLNLVVYTRTGGEEGQ